MNFLSKSVTLKPVLPYDLVSWQYWWGIIKLKSVFRWYAATVLYPTEYSTDCLSSWCLQTKIIQQPLRQSAWFFTVRCCFSSTGIPTKVLYVCTLHPSWFCLCPSYCFSLTVKGVNLQYCMKDSRHMQLSCFTTFNYLLFYFWFFSIMVSKERMAPNMHTIIFAPEHVSNY